MRQSDWATLLWWNVNMFCPVSSRVCTAGGDRRRRVKELFLHIGLFDKHTGSSQENDTVENLQSDHPAHRDRQKSRGHENKQCQENNQKWWRHVGQLPQVKQQDTHKRERPLDLHWAGHHSDQLKKHRHIYKQANVGANISISKAILWKNDWPAALKEAGWSPFSWILSHCSLCTPGDTVNTLLCKTSTSSTVLLMNNSVHSFNEIIC